MIVFLDGKFIPEKKALVSVFDRSFLLGDGLYETALIWRGQAFRWPQHLQRLQAGADFLKLRLPFGPEKLTGFLHELIRRNEMPECVLRLTLSRGTGPRGYSLRNADHPLLVMTLHPVPAFDWTHPPRWRLVTASFRIPPGERPANFKTCSKLTHVLARAEAEAIGADEALLLNTRDELAEAASSNVFWIERNVVCTPPLASGVLAGVTRELLMELCLQLHIPVVETPAPPAALIHAEGVFLTLSTLGIVEVTEFDGHKLKSSPLVEQLRQAYRKTLGKETATRSSEGR